MPKAVIEVAAASTLADGETVKFFFRDGEQQGEGFIVRHEGQLFAWRNRCCHIPLTLDWVENRFLTRDRCHILCATHGALYEINSGRCVWGPPLGQALEPIEIEERDGSVFVIAPNPTIPTPPTVPEN